MIKWFIVLLLTCAVEETTAQVNYVRNPSFEQYSHCPDLFDQIGFANYWSSTDTNWKIADSITSYALCLPEYCNVCGSHAAAVPAGDGYYHYPRSGNGMAQEIMFDNLPLTGSPDDFRDKLQGRLLKPLSAGVSYCVTFFVVMDQISGYAVDHIGAYLDDGSIDAGQDSLGCALPNPSVVPQILCTTIIRDTLNWTMIQGSFIASGSETFITIANFFDSSHTDKIFLNSNGFSPYLVDDVSVIKSGTSANAGDDTMIAAGDSVYIGIPDEGMPCWWYKYGDTTAIGYSGGIWVKPDTTTSYVVKMNLCGDITYDTVTVTVNTVGVGKITKNNLQIFPNPAHSTLNVFNARGYDLDICNPIGQPVFHAKIVSDKIIIDVSDLPFGVYIARFTDEYSNVTCKKVVKE